MEKDLYRNEKMEQELKAQLEDLIAARFGSHPPAPVAERIAVEEKHIFGHGYGTVLAVAAKVAQFSREKGYPVGLRGLTGNLYLSYLLGLAAIDPLRLGLRWESCLGLTGDRMPDFTPNVAPELIPQLKEYLTELLPECELLFAPPDLSPWRILLIPRNSGGYDPQRKYAGLCLCPHRLLSLAGGAPGGDLPPVDVFRQELVLKAYREDVSAIPVLGDLSGFQEYARLLEPQTFPDLTKVMGMCLAPSVQFQADRLKGLSDRFIQLIGTREDLYEFCLRQGLQPGHAHRVTQQVSLSGGQALSDEFRELLAQTEPSDLFWETLDAITYLYPRGQCADYLYWAMSLLPGAK